MAFTLKQLHTDDSGIQYLEVPTFDGKVMHITADSAQQFMTDGADENGRYANINPVDFFSALGVLMNAKSKDLKSETDSAEKRAKEQAALDAMAEVIEPIKAAVLPSLADFLSTPQGFRLSFKSGNVQLEYSSGTADDVLAEWNEKLNSPSISFEAETDDDGTVSYKPSVKPTGTRKEPQAMLIDGMYEIPAENAKDGASFNFSIENGRIRQVWNSAGTEIEKPSNADKFLIQLTNTKLDSEEKRDDGEYKRPFSWAMRTVAGIAKAV